MHKSNSNQLVYQLFIKKTAACFDDDVFPPQSAYSAMYLRAGALGPYSFQYLCFE